jgi:hypothetical protein
LERERLEECKNKFLPRERVDIIKGDPQIALKQKNLQHKTLTKREGKVLTSILGYGIKYGLDWFITKEEREMRKALVNVTLGALLLFVIGSPALANASGFKVEPTLTPPNPHMGEITQLTVRVYSYYYDIPQAVVRFVPREGIALVEGPETYTVALKKGVWEEVKFKVKFTNEGAPFGLQRLVDVGVRIVAKSYRTMEGKLIQTGPPDSLWEHGGYGYILDAETGQFYIYPGRKQNPNEGLVKELGLPKDSLVLAAHLSRDIKDFMKAKGIGREEVIKLLKEKAQNLQQKRKVNITKAYDIILRERLLWKDAGLPDPRGPESMPKEDKTKGMLEKPTQDDIFLFDA